MQYLVIVKCKGCEKTITTLDNDTAWEPGGLGAQIQKVVLEHRSNCLYYKVRKEEK